MNEKFKDYYKFLSVSLYLYLFVLVIIFIIKLVGLDYFNLDINNPFILRLNNFATKYNLENIWYFITLYVYTLCILSVTCNDKECKGAALIFTLIGVIIKVLEKQHCNSFLVAIIDIIYLYFICIVHNKKYTKTQIIKRTTKIIILTFIYQSISMLTRVGNNIDNSNYGFIQFVILDLDFILMYIITYVLYFNERRVELCTTEVGFFSRKKISLKKSLKELQTNYSNFKKQDKKYKFTIIFYLILSFIWNIANILLVFFIAFLNDTLVECVFIVSSFLITKNVFGKAFHFNSMAKCFVVSNLIYYCLNKITTPLGISIFIPILLGVGLSYVTSKFVKKLYKPLYKGMSQNLFDESILKVVDKDSSKYNICYDFYVNKDNALKLSRKYNYTEAGIRKIINRINNKIKELNK